MIAAFAVLGFVAFLLAVGLLLAAVSFASTGLALLKHRRPPFVDVAEIDAEIDAFGVIAEGLADVRAVTDPLALARIQAERLAAILAGRLGDHDPAVTWAEDIARRLAGPGAPPRRLPAEPRQFRMLVDELEETRTLARLAGACVRLRNENATTRPADSSRYGTTPLGILEDCVIRAQRWGRLALTTCNTPRAIEA